MAEKKVQFEQLNILTKEEWREAAIDDAAYVRDNQKCWVCTNNTKFMYPMMPVVACSACWDLVERLSPQVYDRWCKACDEFNRDKQIWARRE